MVDGKKVRKNYKEFDYLSLHESSQNDLIAMVQKHHNDPDNHDKMRYLPIVDASSTMNLMYMIKVEELKDYCELYFGFKGDSEPGIGIQLTQH